jgi:hypothetical protein
MSSEHAEEIRERLLRAANHARIGPRVLSDFSLTFAELGLPAKAALILANDVIYRIGQCPSMKAAEINVRKLLAETKVQGGNLLQETQRGWRDRANKIFQQLSPLLRETSGKVFDYGMGSGAVTQRLQDELRIEVEGGDVRDFRLPYVTVPFRPLKTASSDGKIVNVKAGYYDTAVLTNVIHHERENEMILRELDRITKTKLIVIETVPDGSGPAEIEEDLERTFAVDALWNRFFIDGDIPVPGTYETPEGWVKRFKKYGWENTVSQPLGYDHAAIRVIHHLLVFERNLPHTRSR